MGREIMAVKNLGIIGGTFNPIHYGHLMAAEFARMEYHLDTVIFMPAYIPAHKEGEDILEAKYRYSLVKMAIGDNPAFQVSDLEMKRKGISYTIDTIDHFLKIYPDWNISFIMGMDSLLQMNTWKDIHRLAGLCHFIVVTRPGYEIDMEPELRAKLPDILWEHVSYLEIPGMDISSTEIRTRIRAGKTIKYLLPAAVEGFIHEHRLYREGE